MTLPLRHCGARNEVRSPTWAAGGRRISLKEIRFLLGRKKSGQEILE